MLRPLDFDIFSIICRKDIEIVIRTRKRTAENETLIKIDEKAAESLLNADSHYDHSARILRLAPAETLAEDASIRKRSRL